MASWHHKLDDILLFNYNYTQWHSLQVYTSLALNVSFAYYSLIGTLSNQRSRREDDLVRRWANSAQVNSTSHPSYCFPIKPLSLAWCSWLWWIGWLRVNIFHWRASTATIADLSLDGWLFVAQWVWPWLHYHSSVRRDHVVLAVTSLRHGMASDW